MLFDFQRHGGDDVVDRWVDNVFIQGMSLADRKAATEPSDSSNGKAGHASAPCHVHSPFELLLPFVEPDDLSNDDAAMWIMMCERCLAEESGSARMTISASTPNA